MKKLYNQKTILSLIIMMIFLILSTIIFCICHKPIFYTTDSLRYINLDLIAHPYLVNVLDEQLTKKTLEKEGYTIFGANGKYSFSAGSASNDIWISLTVPTSSGSQETSGVSSAHYTTNVPYFKATVSGFNFDYYTVYVTITINHVTMINEEEGQLSSSKTSISTLSADGNTAFIDKRNGIAEFVVEAKNFDCTFKFTKNKSTSSSITYTITDDRRDTYGTSNSIPRDVSECLEQLIENQKTDDGKFSIVGYHQDNPSKWWDGEFAQCRSDYFVYSDEPVFYANFVPNTYTIKYDGNGATGGSTVSSSHTYDSSKNLTKNGFEKK